MTRREGPVRHLDVRSWSRSVLVLRLVMVGAGVVALAAAPGGGLSPVAVVLGAGGLVAAALNPGGLGPGFVLGGGALAWVLGSELDQAPAAGTVLVALALALHHQAAALAAAVPPTAQVGRPVLVRAGRHAALVLGLSALVAVLALGVARPGGSVPLEMLGLVAAVVAVAVPVWLSRVGGDTR